MSIKRRIIFAIASGWGSKAINILINLVQIPLLYKYLNNEILGIWFLMIGAQMIVGLFDFGFGQTLQRRIAFIKGTCGSSPDLELSDSAKQGITDLLALSKRVYVVLSFVVTITLILGGSIYFHQLGLSKSGLENLNSAWIIMSIGYAANMWGWFVEATLNGLGDIGWSSLIGGALRLVEFAAMWIALALGYSLGTLALIWVLRGVFTRLLGWMVALKLHPWLSRFQGRRQGADFKDMVIPALQWWAAVASYFFLAGISRYLIAALMGADYVPDYVATYTALVVVQGTLMSIVSVATPLLSQMWRSGSLAEVQRLISNLTRIALSLLAAAFAFLCVYGHEIFELWLGQGHFVGYPVLIVLTIMMVIEGLQGMLMTVCVASEQLKFYKFIIAGGLLSLPLSFLLIARYGLLGAALGILISGLVTQNWAIPYLALKIMHLQFKALLKNILLPALTAGLSVTLVGLAIKSFALKLSIGLPIYVVLTSLILAALMYNQITSNIMALYKKV